MGEFEALVARSHDAGLDVIIDFVPNHTARSYHSDAAPAGIEDFGAHDDTNMFFSPSNNYYYITRQLFAPSIDLGTGVAAANLSLPRAACSITRCRNSPASRWRTTGT